MAQGNKKKDKSKNAQILRVFLAVQSNVNTNLFLRNQKFGIFCKRYFEWLKFFNKRKNSVNVCQNALKIFAVNRV